MEQIFGRSREIQTLNRIASSKKAEFLALWGRRRVGKTYLIDRFFRSKGLYFHFTGMKDASLQEHLKLFHYTLTTRFELPNLKPFKSWLDALLALQSAIRSMPHDLHVTIFFDELPWIATKRSGFLKVLEHFWNDFLAKRPCTTLIVCGSAASWMIEKIVNNKGGLHNRITEKMRIDPFTLAETESFLKGFNINLSRKQVVDLYMITGGVAQYLTYAERGQSSTQIVQSLCFNKNSPLLSEYKSLFASLFHNYQHHLAVVGELSKQKGGLTHTELLQKTGLPSGGSFTKLLEELKEAGFIDSIPSFDKKKKEMRFYLCDAYCLFYHTWIKDFRPQIKSDYWLEMLGSSRHLAWSGFAFESVCKNHLKQIVSALGIQLVAIDAVYWRASDKSCQIDLIIDRKDNTTNLCEIKYHNSVVSFNSQDAQKIVHRRERFKELTKTKKTLINTLISAYGAHVNSSYLEAFDQQITIDDLFS